MNSSEWVSLIIDKLNVWRLRGIIMRKLLSLQQLAAFRNRLRLDAQGHCSADENSLSGYKRTPGTLGIANVLDAMKRYSQLLFSI
jgi:hypothetical protein